MSDQMNHDLDELDSCIPVRSEDIIRSGPIERGVSREFEVVPTLSDHDKAILFDESEKRASHWKAMALEADKRVKELEKEVASRAAMAGSRVEQVRLLCDTIRQLRSLVDKADGELAQAQNLLPATFEGSVARRAADRCIDNARAALTKAKEVL